MGLCDALQTFIVPTQVGAVVVYTYVFSMLAPPVRPKELDGSTSTNNVTTPKAEIAQESEETNAAATSLVETSISMPFLALDVPPPRPQVRF